MEECKTLSAKYTHQVKHCNEQHGHCNSLQDKHAILQGQHNTQEAQLVEVKEDQTAAAERIIQLQEKQVENANL